ncbi:MAG TPA: chromosome segregation protein SMC, partial [Candidatus Ornithoclostridium excrementipullorum]|nr:chromosome segregation protein SMC [Candidatus Ornithoclostridium excrementipullorum]
QLETKAEELSDLVNHLSMANEDKRELEAEIAGIEKKYLTLVDEIVGRERDIENTNRAMMEALASIADIKADKGKLGAERDAALQRIGELESECDVIKRTLENDEKAKREHEQSAERKLQQKNKLAKNKNEVAEEAADVELKAEAKRRNIENLRSEISALETKRRLLEEFSNTPSSRLISAAKRDPAVSKKIVGMVAELISVPKEYEVAIETALGSSLQNIVTRNEDDAKALIAYLKANGLGRVTFLPMTSYKARDLDAYQLPILRERGCVGVASKLIRYDKAYENIVSGLLGRTVICDTIDNAVAIARRYSYSVKIVTLGGDVLNTTGSMTGGSRSSRTSILAQEREIAEAKQSIADKTAQLKKLQDTMSEDSAYVRELQEQLAEYEEEVKAAEVAYATELERLDRICAKINDALAELENKGKMLELLNGKLAAIEANLSEIDRSESDISGVRTDADDKASRTKAEFEEKKRLRDKYSEDLTARRIELANAAAAAEKVGGDIDRVKRECTELKEQLNESKSEIAVLATRIAQAESGLNNAVVSDKDKERYEKIKKDIADANEYKSGLDEKLNELTARKDELQKQTVSLSEAKVKQEAALERIDDTLNALGEHLREEYGIESYADAQAYRAEDFDVASAAGEITKLKRERSALGSVNLEAIEQFREVGAEYEQQKKEYDDLIAAREDFEKIIADLSKQMLERFNAEFVKIQDNFREIFRELFGGGTGKLELEPPENGDMLEAGVEIYAQPPGKLLKSMSLLSGGEKALTAIAILFSILKLRPMPFVILDETEAALDESNVEVFARYLKKFSGNTQFIVVTHRKPTMELADRLYGVTMQEKGVSTIVTVSLSEAVRHSSNDA